MNQKQRKGLRFSPGRTNYSVRDSNSTLHGAFAHCVASSRRSALCSFYPSSRLREPIGTSINNRARNATVHWRADDGERGSDQHEDYASGKRPLRARRGGYGLTAGRASYRNIRASIISSHARAALRCRTPSPPPQPPPPLPPPPPPPPTVLPHRRSEGARGSASSAASTQSARSELLS